MRQLRVRVPLASVDLAIALLWEAGAGGIEEREAAPGEAELGVGVDDLDDGDVAELISDLEELAAGRAELVDLTGAPDRWRDEWAAHARATVVADALVVRPPWVESPRPDLPDIVIDPGEAWGHGGHVTTRLALGLLAGAPVPLGPRVLDVGCGSGVLAIAAAALGAVTVTGVDTDPSALVATLANAAANRVHVTVMDTLPPAEVGRAEIVIANIEAPVLLALAADLVGAVAGDGRLLLSGFLLERADEVSTAMVTAGMLQGVTGLVERARVVEEGWAAIELA